MINIPSIIVPSFGKFIRACGGECKATTLFDFIRRAMPFTTPKLLSDDEVYAVTAFILQRNRVIPEDAVMNAATLPRVLMPNRENFIDLWAKQRERPY